MPETRHPLARPSPWSTWALLRMAAAALMLAVLANLGGCGPGVGGTGTGADAPVQDAIALATRPADLCAAEFAALLACGSGTGSAANPADPTYGAGTAAVVLADGQASARNQARISGQHLDLVLRCEGWVFEGTWADSPDLGLRWYGRLQRAEGSTGATVTMRSASSGTVVAALYDLQGQALALPLTLRRVASDTPPAECP